MPPYIGHMKGSIPGSTVLRSGILVEWHIYRQF